MSEYKYVYQIFHAGLNKIITIYDKTGTKLHGLYKDGTKVTIDKVIDNITKADIRTLIPIDCGHFHVGGSIYNLEGNLVYRADPKTWYPDSFVFVLKKDHTIVYNADKDNLFAMYYDQDSGFEHFKIPREKYHALDVSALIRIKDDKFHTQSCVIDLNGRVLADIDPDTGKVLW